MVLLPDHIPTYINQTVDAAPKQVVTANRWNELFNLLITQGDNTSKAVADLLTALAATTAATNVGASVDSVVAKNVQAILTAFESSIAARYTSTQTDTLVSTNTNDLVRSIVFNDQTGAFVITKKDGTIVTIDTVLEKVPVSMVFETVEGVTKIKLTNQDGTTSFADVTALVDNYTFSNTDTVALNVTGVGNQRTISAEVRAASLGLDKLNLEAVTVLQGYVASASNSEEAAHDSELAAAASEGVAGTQATNASGSADAAAYSAAAALASKNAAATSETNALTFKNAAATSETNAATSAATALAAAREVFISGQNDFTYTAVANNVTTFTIPIAYSASDAVTLIRQNLVLVRGVDYTLSEVGLVTLTSEVLNTGDKVYGIINGTSYDANNLANKTIFATPLDVAKVNDKVVDLSNTLSTANLNQSPTQTVTGYDKILSLPKNAANAGASVGVKGMTAQNLVVNGDFSNGTTGWSSYAYATNLRIVNNNLTFDTPTNASIIFSGYNFPVVSGHKYYAKIKISSTVEKGFDFYLRTSAAIASNISTETSVGTTPKVLSEVLTATLTSSQAGFFIRKASTTTELTATIYKDSGISLIDLTAILQDTLTATQAEAVFPTWFDGLKSTKSRGRVKSVGKNLLRTELSNFISGSINDSGVAVVDAQVVYTKDLITVKTLQYTVKSNALIGGNPIVINRYVEYGQSGEFLRRVYVSVSNPQSYTPSADCKYMRLLFRFPTLATLTPQNVLDSQPQLELGSVATTYEPYKSSELYINATEPLRRVPNGTVDEIRKRADGGYERVGRNVEYTLVAGDVTSLYTSYANVDSVLIKKPIDSVNHGNSSTNQAFILVGYGFFSGAADLVANIGKVRTDGSNTYYELIVAKGTYATTAAAQTALAGTKIIYQLATPVITPIETSGTLLSYPSGSVYFESITADAGIYNSGINIMATGFPISALETLSKVDFNTGVETALDVSTAVIAGNGLSFTHPGLSNGNIVFFTYSFKGDAPEGNKTVSYLDSRYVVADTTNGKFYQWKISTTNGVPSITAVEV